MNRDIVEQIISGVARDYHINGSLSPYVLNYMVDLFISVGAKVSAETGCGLTTLILSNLGERHLSFADGSGDSLPKTQCHEYFNAPVVQFVVGPSQKTLPHYKFDQPLDFVLIDGPHAFPFPDLEYYYFYQNIRAGGILVIDDFHIPTIGNLYMFLREDEMWRHVADVETTAFFQRTQAPTHNPIGDDWHLQRFNRRYFPYPAALNSKFGEGWYEREFSTSVAARPARGQAVPEFAPPPGILKILEQQTADRERFRADALLRQLMRERLAMAQNTHVQARKIANLQATVRRLRREKLEAEALAADRSNPGERR
jgi:hypothetical protein